jgi:hypothetical protein
MCRLGHPVGSALAGPRLERPPQTRAPIGWTVTNIQWEVAPTSASTRGMRVTGGRVWKEVV